MRAIVQRVKESAVSVDGETTGRIGPGMMVLLGVSREDTEEDADYLVDKIVNLRIFQDDQQKMNRSLLQTEGAMLVVSQFTLYGDYSKGRRPSFVHAAAPETAEALYTYFINRVKEKGIVTAQGRFGAMMDVHLINDGPVTLIVHSKQEARI